MADFFKVTTSKLPTNTEFVGTGLKDVPNDGPANASQTCTTDVGATGDNFANTYKADTSLLRRATSTIPLTGANFAK